MIVFLNVSEIPRGEGSGNISVCGGSRSPLVKEKESSSSRSADHPPRKGLEAVVAPSLLWRLFQNLSLLMISSFFVISSRNLFHG